MPKPRGAGRFLYLLPALAYMGLIFFLSSLTPDELRGAFRFGIPDKLFHAAGYGGLAATFYLAFVRAFRCDPRTGVRLAWLFAVAYGVTDEWHQGFVGGRVPSFGDLIADAVGAGLVVLWIGRRFAGGRRGQRM